MGDELVEALVERLANVAHVNGIDRGKLYPIADSIVIMLRAKLSDDEIAELVKR